MTARWLSCEQLPVQLRAGAGEGTRTLDIQLGKLTLYQLSYARSLGSRGRLARGAGWVKVGRGTLGMGGCGALGKGLPTGGVGLEISVPDAVPVAAFKGVG